MIYAELTLPQPGQDCLSRLAARMPGLLRDSLEQALEHGLRAARARLAPGGGGPTSRSGYLAGSLSARVEGSGQDLLGLLAAGAPYAAAQEHGALIQARRAAYLKFQVQGRWVMVKQVLLPARPFLGPAAEQAADALLELLFKALEEELS